MRWCPDRWTKQQDDTHLVIKTVHILSSKKYHIIHDRTVEWKVRSDVCNCTTCYAAGYHNTYKVYTDG